MSASRYSGHVTVRMALDPSAEYYTCTVTARNVPGRYHVKPDGSHAPYSLSWRLTACLSHCERAVLGADSAEAFDSIARAALSFAFNEARSPELGPFGGEIMSACELSAEGSPVIHRRKRMRAQR